MLHVFYAWLTIDDENEEQRSPCYNQLEPQIVISQDYDQTLVSLMQSSAGYQTRHDSAVPLLHVPIY